MPNVKLLDPKDARRRLDRYELIGEIASGGMATVFLARLAGAFGFQRLVAIKRLHPHLAEEQEFVDMFLDEARLAAGIHHPHVVPILEVGVAGGTAGASGEASAPRGGFYLVMEYVEGDTLARLFTRAAAGGRPVPRAVLVRVLLDALAGLHAAHELTDAGGRPVALVHRDCSPQNILVGADGCSRITDFGVAHATSRLSSTRSDRLKGKLAYMAPEQVRGGPIDRRADVFAMGIVLWEVLSGVRLFKAENEAATLSRVVLEPIPRLRDVAPELPPALDAVCAKALEREPSCRYQSAAEMAEALERAAREADVGVASAREVAAAVHAALGPEIAAQRERVRAWLQSDPTPAAAPERALGDAAASSRDGRRATAQPARPDSDDPTLSAPGPAGSARSSWSEPLFLGASAGAVIPVELPPDPPASVPPPEDDPALAAREASLTGVLAFSRRPSFAPYATALLDPAARRRGRLARAATAIALVGVALFCWKVTWPRAAKAVDEAADRAAAAPPRAAPALDVALAPPEAAPAAPAPATPARTEPSASASPAPPSAASSRTAATPGRRAQAAPAAAPADDLANPYR